MWCSYEVDGLELGFLRLLCCVWCFYFCFFLFYIILFLFFFFFSSRRRHTRCGRDWSSDVCSSDLPFGTTNDFANMLGLGKDIDFNLALLKTKHYRLSDVYRLNDEYFIYAAAAGKFTNISYNIDRSHLRKMGSFGYIFNARKDLLKKYDLKIDVKTSKLHIKRKAFLIFIAAGSRVGGFNISKFSKSPKFNDGKIDVRIFTRNHIFSWMKLIWFYIFKGRHFHNDIHIHTDDITIRLDDDAIWNVDGEAGPKGDINVQVLSKQIEVYVHPKMIYKLDEERKPMHGKNTRSRQLI